MHTSRIYTACFLTNILVIQNSPTARTFSTERATLRSYICISNRSKLRVERTKKSLARNSRVLRVQVLCCLYTDDCNDSERECARKMNEKSLHLNANGAFFPSIQATIAMQ